MKYVSCLLLSLIAVSCSIGAIETLPSWPGAASFNGSALRRKARAARGAMHDVINQREAQRRKIRSRTRNPRRLKWQRRRVYNAPEPRYPASADAPRAKFVEVERDELAQVDLQLKGDEAYFDMCFAENGKMFDQQWNKLQSWEASLLARSDAGTEIYEKEMKALRSTWDRLAALYKMFCDQREQAQRALVEQDKARREALHRKQLWRRGKAIDVLAERHEAGEYFERYQPYLGELHQRVGTVPEQFEENFGVVQTALELARRYEWLKNNWPE